MRGLNGKVVVVTGGAGAIGRAVCVRLTEEGCTVGIFDRNRDAAEELEEHIANTGGKARAITVDLTHRSRCDDAIAAFVGWSGEVDVLVNGAGYHRSQRFVDSEPKYWDSIVDVSLRVHMNIIHALLPSMVRRRRGRVVTIATEAGRVGAVGQAVQAACAGAMIALSKTLAREHARDGVGFNVVCVGPHDPRNSGEPHTTIDHSLQALVPAGRLGHAGDVVGAVAFLASDDADFVTGQVLSASGGMTMVD
jgi:2-hydroxycyclohexanecarboxyl-CoA dehydrogenase